MLLFLFVITFCIPSKKRSKNVIQFPINQILYLLGILVLKRDHFLNSLNFFKNENLSKNSKICCYLNFRKFSNYSK